MGKSFTREDGLMIDSSVIALDNKGTSLHDGFLHKTVTIDSESVTITDSRITSNMRVCNAVLSAPEILTSDITWTTANGSVTFTQTITSGTSTTIDFDLILFNS